MAAGATGSSIQTAGRSLEPANARRLLLAAPIARESPVFPVRVAAAAVIAGMVFLIPENNARGQRHIARIAVVMPDMFPMAQEHAHACLTAGVAINYAGAIIVAAAAVLVWLLRYVMKRPGDVIARLFARLVRNAEMTAAGAIAAAVLSRRVVIWRPVNVLVQLIARGKNAVRTAAGRSTAAGSA